MGRLEQKQQQTEDRWERLQCVRKWHEDPGQTPGSYLSSCRAIVSVLTKVQDPQAGSRSADLDLRKRKSPSASLTADQLDTDLALEELQLTQAR